MCWGEGPLDSGLSAIVIVMTVASPSSSTKWESCCSHMEARSGAWGSKVPTREG